MTKNNAIVAVFTGHRAAEDAVRKLAKGGLDIAHFSIVGKGYHSEEKVVGFSTPVTASCSGARMARCGEVSGAFSLAVS